MQNQQLEWNKIFENCGHDKPKIDDWLNKYLHILELSKNLPVIDLGCGFGNDTLFLSQKGFRVISCDYSEEALSRLKYFIENPEIKLFNLLDGLPFSDNFAKVMIADLSLHYFSFNDTQKIVKDISRVLMDGGYLLCRVNSVNDIEFGAGHGAEIEEHYYDIAENFKRFFDRKQIDVFFSAWSIEYANECEMDRYSKLKRVWEIALKNIKKF
jgi:SAM-dependent methyltransferase